MTRAKLPRRHTPRFSSFVGPARAEVLSFDSLFARKIDLHQNVLLHPPLPVLRTGAARRLLKALCTFWEGCCCCRLRATGNAITPSPRDGGSYRVALQQYKSFWQDSTLDLCQAGRRRSFARQGLSDEASRSLVLVGVCGDDSALWGYGRKPPLTHTLPHYHVTWRIPAAPPLGDAFDLAHPPLPVLRTGAARRLLKALCPFWEGCLLLSAEGHR